MNKHERPTRRGFVLLGAALTATSAGLVAARAEDPPTAEVGIDNFVFKPATLTIKPGTRVTFVNHDDIPHLVVETTGKFRSKALDTDQSYDFTFTTAGTYNYYCGLHPHMQGSVVVAP